jgi:MerR HTH family regulatory protein
MNKTTLQCIMDAVSQAPDISQEHKLKILKVCNQKETVQDPPGFITTKMVSRLLGVTTRTVRNYVTRGTLTPKYISKRKMFFRIEEIKQLIYDGADAGRYIDELTPEADAALPEDIDIEEHPAMQSYKQEGVNNKNMPVSTGMTAEEYQSDLARKRGLTSPE